MAKITELRRYKESKEFQEIAEKLNNKAENIYDKIETLYRSDEKIDNTAIYSTVDLNVQRSKDLEDIIGDIKSTTEWAGFLREEMQAQIDNGFKMCRMSIRDKFGLPLTSPLFTEVDYNKAQAHNFKEAITIIDGLILAEEKEEEPEDKIYE